MLCRHSIKSVQMNRCVAFALGQIFPSQQLSNMKAVCLRFESQGETQSPSSTAAAFFLSFCGSLVLNSPMVNLRSIACLSDLHTVCVLKFNSPRFYWKPSAHSSAVLLQKWINWAWAHLCPIWLCIISRTDPWCRCLSWTLNVRLIAHFSGTHNVLSMLWNLCTHWRGLWRKIYVTVSCMFLLPGFTCHSM